MFQWLQKLWQSQNLSEAPEIVGSVGLSAETTETLIEPRSYYNGSKFPGGVTGMIDSTMDSDYWSLRRRSGALFKTTSVGRGIIRRFVTNVIATGLEVEALPVEILIGREENSMEDWSERVEMLFSAWGRDQTACDAKGVSTWGMIQASIYRESLIDGDCVVVNRVHPTTGLPQIQVIPGNRIQTPPMLEVADPNARIVEGVELGPLDRHIAYWVYLDPDDILISERRWIRIPVFGERTGRRQAWMVYGWDKREDGVRGDPLLSIAIQGISEIDKYMDATSRKRVINSYIVGSVENNDGVPPSLPVQNAAKKKEVVASPDGSAKPLEVNELMPGMWVSRLNKGEKLTHYVANNASENFDTFVDAVICGLAWAMEIPPECLKQSYDSNYSASQSASGDWSMVITRERTRFGAQNNDFVYQDWFLAKVLSGDIQAEGYIEALTSNNRREISTAWTWCDWNGAIKSHIDITKQVNGYKGMVGEGWITNDRVTRHLNGTKYTRNTRRLQRENQMKIDALRPILEAKAQYGEAVVDAALGAEAGGDYSLRDALEKTGIAQEDVERIMEDSDVISMMEGARHVADATRRN